MSDDPVQKRKRNEVKKAAQAIFFAPNGDMPDAQRVFLRALAVFCAAGTTPRSVGPIGIDTNATMLMVGRQEVWFWLNKLLGIPDIDVARLAIPPAEPGE